jgi:hypothetical protein
MKAKCFFISAIIIFIVTLYTGFSMTVGRIPDVVYFAPNAENSIVSKLFLSAVFEPSDEAVYVSASDSPLFAETEPSAELGTVTVSAFGIPFKRVVVDELPEEGIVPCGCTD